MKYKRLLAIGLAMVMVFAFTACKSGGDKGSADNRNAKLSDKLEFEGEWKEAGPIKLGMPDGWSEFDVSSTDVTANIDIKSKETYDDDTVRVEASYSLQYNLGSDDWTLEDWLKSEIPDSTEMKSDIERVDVAGLTFAKAEYAYDETDVRTTYLYVSGQNDKKEAITLTLELLGSYQDSELVPKIVNSFRFDFPKEFESLKNEVVDREPLATGGTVETDKFKVEVPDDWSVRESDDRSAEFASQTIESATISIDTYDSSIFGDAAKNAESIAGNFRNEYPVETKDIGNLHLIGITLDSQFYMCVDSNDGSYYAKISGMFCTLEQATPFIEKITLK